MPLSPHSLEQHWAPVSQALPELLHDEILPLMSLQLPSAQVPPQHWASLLQLRPSEVQASAWQTLP